MNVQATRDLVLGGVICVALVPTLWAGAYTQSQLFDQLLTEDDVLSELADHIESYDPGSGFLRSLRNPQVRASYGEDTDEQLGGGVRLDEDRDSWEVDLRLFPPNPYAVSAAKAEAKAGHLGVMATAQQYVSMKINRARNLWAELRYATGMQEDLASVSAFWDSAGDVLSEAAGEDLNLGPDLIRWQMKRLQFMETKLDVDSRRRNALRELAALAGLKQASFRPSFHPLTKNRVPDEGRGFEPPEVLEQKMRVAREQARVADARADSVPWLDHVQGSYGERSSDVERESWSVQVAVSLPVFSVFSGEGAQRRTVLKAEEASLLLLEQEQQELLFSLAETIDRKLRILSMYDREVVPLVKSLTSQMSSGDLGPGGSLDEQIKRADSILRAVEAYHDVQLELEQALIEKDALLGRIP